MKARYRNIGTALLGALVIGAAGTQAVALPDTDPVAQHEFGAFGTGPTSFSELVKTVKPAVVNISISGRSPMGGEQFRQRQFNGPGFPEGSPFDDFREHFDRPEMRGQRGPVPEFQAVGSGFIISADGLVVTNNHVIENAEEIDVVLQDGTRYPATIQGRDPKMDLALLKIDADDDLPYVELGSSDDAEVGDWVLAVGNPFGLGGTVTAGIISARGRDIQAGPFDDFLQIDASINRGNSGGPLFDVEGRVIGINTAIFSPSGGNIGIGFAIPSALAGDIIDQLKDSGTVERGWLGVEFQPVTEAFAASLGLDGAHGALVAGVVEDGPADRAGLQMGDVIVALDGESLDDPKDLPRMVAKAKAGTEVVLEVLRNGKMRRLEVKIGRSESEAMAGMEQVPAGPAKLGVQLSELNAETGKRFGVYGTDGVLVTDVQRGSPAAKAGIRPGQVITMVGQKEVGSPQELVKEVEKASEEGRPSVLLMIEQGDAKRFVAVELAT